ncbi:MAG: hypothetical protein L0Y66_08170 [Myxococcaceae bacterium]|nr:hypothetical protein [Myxococcaceae bacterium]MCI0670384.1 hypothetical protein [Myxococcaceae bacterium]
MIGPLVDENGNRTLRRQVSHNLVAIISLALALSSLGYSAWRNERTERNRSIRQAGFEVLKNLGELQMIVNATHFGLGDVPTDPLSGWGRVSLIGDLCQLLSPPVPAECEGLVHAWGVEWTQLREDEASVKRISERIDDVRNAVLAELRRLR